LVHIHIELDEATHKLFKEACLRKKKPLTQVGAELIEAWTMLDLAKIQYGDKPDQLGAISYSDLEGSTPCKARHWSLEREWCSAVSDQSPPLGTD
jgi:hypothetical protein